MYTVKFTTAYKKSYKLMKKRGLDISLLDDVVDTLRQGSQTPRSVNLSMLTNPRAAGLLRKSFLIYASLFGKRCSGHRVFAC